MSNKVRKGRVRWEGELVCEKCGIAGVLEDERNGLEGACVRE